MTPKEFLDYVAHYPNGVINHTDDCELRKKDFDDWDEDDTCTCGYWSNAFASIKIEALCIKSRNREL